MESVSLFSITPQSTLLKDNGIASLDSEPSPSESSASQQLMNSFAETFRSRLNQLQSLQDNAQTKMRQFAAGKIENVHDVSIAVQKANMGFRLAGLVRQKVLQGFETLQNLR